MKKIKLTLLPTSGTWDVEMEEREPLKRLLPSASLESESRRFLSLGLRFKVPPLGTLVKLLMEGWWRRGRWPPSDEPIMEAESSPLPTRTSLLQKLAKVTQTTFNFPTIASRSGLVRRQSSKQSSRHCKCASNTFSTLSAYNNNMQFMLLLTYK